MAPTQRPTRSKPTAAKAKPGPKAKATTAKEAESNGSGEAAVAAPKRTRNVRPSMPVFHEDIEEGTLTPLGTYKGNTAEEAFDTYLAALEDDDRQAAWDAENYVVFTPDEGMVKLAVVAPTEPSITRR